MRGFSTLRLLELQFPPLEGAPWESSQLGKLTAWNPYSHFHSTPLTGVMPGGWEEDENTSDTTIPR